MIPARRVELIRFDLKVYCGMRARARCGAAAPNY
jgi:hypothetical protein